MKYKKNGTSEEIVKKDYKKSIIFDLADFGYDGHLLQTVTIPSKTKQREHYHDIQTEVFYILEGRCHIFINDKEYVATPGDSFICSPGDKHNLWNKTNKDFKLVVFKINLPNKEDSHWSE